MVAGIAIGRCPRCCWRDWPRRFSYGRQVLHLRTTRARADSRHRAHGCSSGGTSTGPGMIIPVVGIGVLTGFTRTFPAMLAFSLLLAVLSLFSFASIRRTL
jgi:hypothetical protein